MKPMFAMCANQNTLKRNLMLFLMCTIWWVDMASVIIHRQKHTHTQMSVTMALFVLASAMEQQEWICKVNQLILWIWFHSLCVLGGLLQTNSSAVSWISCWGTLGGLPGQISIFRLLSCRNQSLITGEDQDIYFGSACLIWSSMLV